MSDIFCTSWAYSCIFNEAVIMKCYNKNQEKGSYNISIDAKFYFDFKIKKFLWNWSAIAWCNMIYEREKVKFELKKHIN